MKVLTARTLFAAPGRLASGGGVLVDGGHIVRALRSPAAVRRAARDAGVRTEDLGEGVLTAGLVNAHAHLELSALAGRVGGDGSFREWVERLIAARRSCTASALERGAWRGAERLLATGTTAVGDNDATGAARRALARHPLRVRLFREVLDAGDPARTPAALAGVRRALPVRSRMLEGLAPHAPYSVSAALFEATSALAAKRRVPVSIHWSETTAEVEWMTSGRGELTGLLEHSPRRAGLDLIDSAGLLARGTALVHGNCPARGEALRIARAGATLVHCPGSHLFFRRLPFPLETFRRHGTVIALGTDSSTSNDDLDMRREMALVRRAFAQLSPHEVWGMATVAAARAIGLAREIGQLTAGRRADLCLFRTREREAEACVDELTSAAPALEGVWIAGRRVWPR